MLSPKLVVWSLIGALSSACNDSTFRGGESKGPTEVAEKEGGGKTSDDSEGVPGYLTNPKLVEADKRDDDRIEVRGKPNAVAASDGGSPDRLAANIWKTPSEAFETSRLGSGSASELSGTLLGSSPVATDGSFNYTLPGDVGDDQVVLVTVGRAGETAPRLKVPAAKDGRYPAAFIYSSAGEGPFDGFATGEENKYSGFDIGLIADVPLLAQFQMRECLIAAHGSAVTRDRVGPYRQLDLNARSGDAIEETPGNGPELVHVTLNALSMSGLRVVLKNPEATYCLDINALIFNDAEIEVPCKAKVHDGHKNVLGNGVTVKKTGECS